MPRPRRRHLAHLLHGLLLAGALAGCSRDTLAPLAPTSAVSGRSAATVGARPELPIEPPQADGALPLPLQPGFAQYTLVPPGDELFVVALAEGVSAGEVAAALGLTVAGLLPDQGLALLQGSAPLGSVQSAPGVEDASHNQPMLLTEAQDLVFGFHEGDWDESTGQGQWAMTQLQLDLLHTRSRGQGTKIAVLDTGVDAEHPLFATGLELLRKDAGLGSLELANGIDDDGDGVVDNAWGHGTHVCGIVRQVAPGGSILPIRVLNDEGIGSLWDLLRGLDLAAKLGAQVVNLSLSLSGPSSLVEDAVCRLSNSGIVVVAAAGNQAQAAFYPASSPCVLGVAATDTTDAVAGFSNFGPLVDFGAPGVAIVSAFPRGGRATASGTSMAAPFVSASIALVRKWTLLPAMESTAELTQHPAAILPQAAVQFGRVDPFQTMMAWNAGS